MKIANVSDFRMWHDAEENKTQAASTHTAASSKEHQQVRCTTEHKDLADHGQEMRQYGRFGCENACEQRHSVSRPSSGSLSNRGPRQAVMYCAWVCDSLASVNKSVTNVNGFASGSYILLCESNRVTLVRNTAIHDVTQADIARSVPAAAPLTNDETQLTTVCCCPVVH